MTESRRGDKTILPVDVAGVHADLSAVTGRVISSAPAERNADTKHRRSRKHPSQEQLHHAEVGSEAIADGDKSTGTGKSAGRGKTRDDRRPGRQKQDARKQDSRKPDSRRPEPAKGGRKPEAAGAKNDKRKDRSGNVDHRAKRGNLNDRMAYYREKYGENFVPPKELVEQEKKEKSIIGKILSIFTKKKK